MSIHSSSKRVFALVLGLALTATSALSIRQSDGNACPVDPNQLPANTQQISFFGERAAWSPDGSKLAFMSKSFGDAFEMDMTTKRVTLLTQPPNAGFLRVQYLLNGDYFLIGSRTFVDIDTTRDSTEEMWILKQGGPVGQAPIPLNQKIAEGVAISRLSNRIAWANNHANSPDKLADGETAIFLADVEYTRNGTPTLANQREILRDMAPHCSLEPQDFRNNDTELIFTCYQGTDDPNITLASVHGIDLRTGSITVYRDQFAEGEYNEVEGIYPDGRFTLVESSKDQLHPHADDTVDIWRLRLEPNSTDFVRLTCFGNNTDGDDPVNKASNPVVSPDGRTVAFQAARSGDAAGVGYGLFLLQVDEPAA